MCLVNLTDREVSWFSKQFHELFIDYEKSFVSVCILFLEMSMKKEVGKESDIQITETKNDFQIKFALPNE